VIEAAPGFPRRIAVEAAPGVLDEAMRFPGLPICSSPDCGRIARLSNTLV
jgi:hypothetical protein